MKRWLACGLMLGCLTAFCQQPALVLQKRLATVDVFAFGGTGYAGKESQGEKDFHVIMAMPPAEAVKIFDELYTFGNPQAKGYALAGFLTLDPRKFETLREALRGETVEVITERGCIMDREFLTQVADELKAGDFPPYPRH